MVVGKFQRAAQVAADGCLDDAHARLEDGRAEILVAIDLARYAHTVEVALGEAAIAGWAALDGRQDAAIYIAAHRIGVGADGSSQVRRAQIAHGAQAPN